MKSLKKILLVGLVVFVFSIIFVFYANNKIQTSYKDKITSELNMLPVKKVGLLLGTSMKLRNGNSNLYFFNRIKAAAELYHAGKIKRIIVSGDNSSKDYNEPEDMKNELIKLGVPSEYIYEDFAGFRTLDSVIRAKDIFGLNSFIIISQKFHNERAVFIAQKFGVDTYGYNAKDVNTSAGLKTNAREKLAKAKVFWDLLFGVKPKYGGEKILIE